MGTRILRLLRRVALRRWISSLGGQFYSCFLVLTGVYAVLLLCSRLLAVSMWSPNAALVVMVIVTLAAAWFTRWGALKLLERAAGAE